MTKQLPRYVVLGEALTDLIRCSDGRWIDRPGGSCWNVARVGARLGIPTGFAGAVSRDYFGDAIAQASEEAGLDERFLQQVDKPPLLAMVMSSQPPKYSFIGTDSADLHFDPSQLPRGWLDQAEMLHFGGISLARRPLANALLALAVIAANAGKKIAFDPNVRTPMLHPSYREMFLRMAGLADYVKVSDEDLEVLFPNTSEQSAIAELRDLAPSAILLYTKGARGMTLIRGAQVLEQQAMRVDVVDTVGCGDAAMGGWVATMLSEPSADFSTQITRAAAAAAVVAAHAGAYAPLEEEVRSMMAGGVK